VLASGQPDALGSLMADNHALLQDLQVSSPALDRLVQAAQQAGALGAKLSGGGRGGNMLALVASETREAVAAALLAAGAVRVIHTVVE
jgi:mevalonate kinase